MLETLATIDARVLVWILSLPHPEWLDWLMAAASAVAHHAGIWLALGVVLAAWGRLSWMAYWQVVLAIVLVFLAVDVVLKPAIGRARPSDANPTIAALTDAEPPANPAMPSGHAATAVAGAYALARVLPTARIVLWLLAALIAVSRLYLGVHYPLDVVAGTLVGSACAALSVGGTVWYSRGPAGRISQEPR
ncbi:MAG: phosphatase PAP2 family protein [Vicinamibacterales bacterium]|jgi:undecaprenyl-diphosphatase|nr:hypothetical protein [Acidobacteriota bacterium]MDP7294304.1 phosphatase PAP2 family protein [Vicinamibacterales bacterium]MDP7471309.1 phosphatase PAP2 family protein [Vicinamibacterales bacterium]MDP7672873.1 phosphatase PAP2 family protein [Vicinamibacterales bacterium]HJO37320.1 phosphatase PAP2 family protein [Vicinamibacterales bacterium]